MFFSYRVSSYITADGNVRDHKIEIEINIPKEAPPQMGACVMKQIDIVRDRIYNEYIRQK